MSANLTNKTSKIPIWGDNNSIIICRYKLDFNSINWTVHFYAKNRISTYIIGPRTKVNAIHDLRTKLFFVIKINKQEKFEIKKLLF